MDDVGCNGDEQYIQDCPYNSNENCGPGEAAGVMCFHYDTTKTTTTYRPQTSTTTTYRPQTSTTTTWRPDPTTTTTGTTTRPTDSPGGECPDGWIKSIEGCYLFHYTG